MQIGLTGRYKHQHGLLNQAVQIVAGLDEGIKDMKVGGLRRLYIPGNLSFPRGVNSAPGRYVTEFVASPCGLSRDAAAGSAILVCIYSGLCLRLLGLADEMPDVCPSVPASDCLETHQNLQSAFKSSLTPTCMHAHECSHMYKLTQCYLVCRPRVPPKTPVIFDVHLLYIPGVQKYPTWIMFSARPDSCLHDGLQYCISYNQWTAASQEQRIGLGVRVAPFLV